MITDSLNAWIPRVQNQYIDMDSAYGAQCWDLAAHWSSYLGLPIINTGGAGRWPGWAGNMVDAYPQSAEIDAAYDLIGPDQYGEPGDIVVWGAVPGLYPSTHVAVLVKDNRNGWLLTMSQNSTLSQAGNPYPEWSTGPTTLQTLPRQGLLGFIRPRPDGITYQGTIIEPEEVDDMADVNKDRLNKAVDRILGRDEQRYVFLDKTDNRIKPCTQETPGAWAARSADVADILNILYALQDGDSRTIAEVSAAYHQGEASADRRANDVKTLVATLSAEELAAAIPDTLAKTIVDELAKRIAA